MHLPVTQAVTLLHNAHVGDGRLVEAPAEPFCRVCYCSISDQECVVTCERHGAAAEECVCPVVCRVFDCALVWNHFAGAAWKSARTGSLHCALAAPRRRCCHSQFSLLSEVPVLKQKLRSRNLPLSGNKASCCGCMS